MNAITLIDSVKNFITMRFSIDQSQVFRLATIEQLRVEKGTVWMTQHGQDILLRAGDVLTRAELSADAVLSVVGRDCAMLEVVFPREDNESLPINRLFEMAA
jgi:hypothetical protein